MPKLNKIVTNANVRIVIITNHGENNTDPRLIVT